METKTKLIEPLLQRVEAYSKTSLELMKLKALGKTSQVTSALISRCVFAVVACFFVMMINITVALWLGEILGKLYYGFLVVAGFYALAGIILLIIHPFIKTKVQDTVIRQMFN